MSAGVCRLKHDMRWLAVLFVTGCAGFQRVPLKSETVRLDDGRFSGPLEIHVPRRAEHANHDFEIRVTLKARCAPKLTLAFPDGETEQLGEDDARWQALLEQRAQQEAVIAPGAPRATSPAGHWQRVTVERWPGQLEFERLRAQRCAGAGEYHAAHLSAYDESGALTLWADVPQELAGAELAYELVERVPLPAPEPEHTVPAAPAAAPAPRPRPEKPAPKGERPGEPLIVGARWRSGEWVWAEGQGEWQWVDGVWLEPATQPAPRDESPGAPPNEGCRWKHGHWSWISRDGHWEWQAGTWSEPPPPVETRGPKPGEGAQWQSGRWTWARTKFIWQSGRWGRPAPLNETIPPPPFAGARWMPGDWLDLDGTWKWSPGFYEGTQRPPPPRAETPPPRPSPDAVWLTGYWRWDAPSQQHSWVPGRWELPPGDGCVWVADTPAVRGHWELRVKVRLP